MHKRHYWCSYRGSREFNMRPNGKQARGIEELQLPFEIMYVAKGCYCERLLTTAPNNSHGGQANANGAKITKDGEEKSVRFIMFLTRFCASDNFLTCDMSVMFRDYVQTRESAPVRVEGRHGLRVQHLDRCNQNGKVRTYKGNWICMLYIMIYFTYYDILWYIILSEWRRQEQKNLAP